MAKKQILLQGGDGTAVPTGMIGEQLSQTWTGVTVTTGGTTLATHSSVTVGVYLFVVEADATNATATRQTTNFGGTATVSISRTASGGDFVKQMDGTSVALYVTYYARVTVAGSITLTSTTFTASTTSNRGSFSIIRLG
jgi:hypothetical protein